MTRLLWVDQPLCADSMQYALQQVVGVSPSSDGSVKLLACCQQWADEWSLLEREKALLAEADRKVAARELELQAAWAARQDGVALAEEKLRTAELEVGRGLGAGPQPIGRQVARLRVYGGHGWERASGRAPLWVLAWDASVDTALHPPCTPPSHCTAARQAQPVHRSGALGRAAGEHHDAHGGAACGDQYGRLH